MTDIDKAAKTLANEIESATGYPIGDDFISIIKLSLLAQREIALCEVYELCKEQMLYYQHREGQELPRPSREWYYLAVGCSDCAHQIEKRLNAVRQRS